MDAKKKAAFEKALTRELLDQGKIIASGWALFKHYVIPVGAPPMQLREMEKAFFAGAQHLFGSIMTGLTEDEEPTPQDEQRMSLIADELAVFGERLQAEIEAEGRA